MKKSFRTHLRVLLVDDNQFVRQLMTNVLRHVGYNKISEAESGAKAIDMLMAQPYDLLITDWVMPEVNGAGLLTILRTPSFPRNKSIPIIVVSGFTTHKLVEQAKALGADAVVTKPFSAKNLDVNIQRVLSQPRHILRPVPQPAARPEATAQPRPAKTNDIYLEGLSGTGVKSILSEVEERLKRDRVNRPENKPNNVEPFGKKPSAPVVEEDDGDQLSAYL